MLNQNKRYMKDTTKPESWTESWKKTLSVLTPLEELSSIPRNTEIIKNPIHQRLP